MIAECSFCHVTLDCFYECLFITESACMNYDQRDVQDNDEQITMDIFLYPYIHG